ncbi:D-hexose-6-phosphate mutarotase [Mangrovibacter yixingensis]|uniref:D-hexose-6-phosphate mutarotase n=1 Tax=Mangrovibacter yixingensis TaxID=1529639 RepID=UPI001CF97A33|nr:D-hexose-6-phosphate mutarotase [Mangrovibacter yixingensis]
MIEKIFALPVLEQVTPTISRRQLGELDILVVDHPAVKASVALQGAHLLSWQPKGEKEVLWLSKASLFEHGQAIRGGVPICWPWFGPAKDSTLPSHGFARNLDWQLSAHNEDSNGVALTFELKSSDASRKYWPHDFTLYARFKLGATCEMELESHGEFETQSALHTYFTVGDIDAVSVSGLGHRFIDKVKDGIEDQLSDGIQTFPDRVDRIYLEPEACSVIHDKSLPRRIDVVHRHNCNVVAWNPGPALSISMSDVPDDGYKTYVCVEAVNATIPQKVSANQPGRLACVLSVSK